MKATLKLEDGRELTVDVSEETLKQIEKPVKKTGYERVKKDERYYSPNGVSNVDSHRDVNDVYDKATYSVANYYSDKTVAENNARADTLMRKLRRFAVEHREHGLDWKRSAEWKYQIDYSHPDKTFHVWKVGSVQTFGTTYFDSEETAKDAIEEFKDELIWYFTEYKDSL